ncbi:hypothetical protein PENSPDRAFT_139148 [Peniophora sp. CONT]|nr:hypothetical protein PENSPDRAFT_139148 [Peniophora sp. CONT]
MLQDASASEEAWRAFILARFGDTSTRKSGRSRDPVATAARLALLDEELRVLQHPKTIALAKRQRNSATPACTLPPEMLARIFSFAQSAWPSKRQALNHKEISIHWLLLSHVCSNWREVALSSPALWCRLPCYDIAKSAIPYVLARSRLNNLLLTFGGWKLGAMGSNRVQRASASLNTWICQPVCQRIRELWIDEDSSVQFERKNWPSLLRCEMPALKSLTIMLGPGPVVTLSDDFLACNAPYLLNIGLMNCFIPWTSPLLTPTVKSLELHMSKPLDVSAFPTLQEFSDALTRMSALQTLLLTDIFPAFNQNQSEGTIILPKSLLSVRFTASAVVTVHNCLMTFLSISTTNVAFDSLCVRGDADRSLIARAISHLFQSPSKPPRELFVASRVIVASSPAQSATFMGDITSSVPSELAMDHRRFEMTRTDTDIPGNGDQTLLPALYLPLVYIDSLRCITVTADAARLFRNAEDWRTAFSRATQVSDLRLHYCPAIFNLFCAFALSLPADPVEPSASEVLFPVLKSLQLHHERGGNRAPVTMIEDEAARLQLATAAFIQARSLYGTSVGELVVEEGLMEEDQIGAIKGMGIRVVSIVEMLL